VARRPFSDSPRPLPTLPLFPRESMTCCWVRCAALTRARWSLNDAQPESFSPANFLASTVGCRAIGGVGPEARIQGRPRAGLASWRLESGPCRWLVGLGDVLGGVLWRGGVGTDDSTANLLVAEVNPDRRASALALFEFFLERGAVHARSSRSFPTG